jgi:hypothetical protein
MAALEQEFAALRQKIDDEVQSPDVSNAAAARMDMLLDQLEYLTRLMHYKVVEHTTVKGHAQ